MTHNATYSVDMDPKTFGVSQESLKRLRDSLAAYNESKIAVVRVPTNEMCCGYLIFVDIIFVDGQEAPVIWTGDGFRMDGGGEGGAAENTARVLFDLFGVWPITDGSQPLYQEDIKQALEAIAASWLAGGGEALDWCRPKDRYPNYIR